MSLFTEIKTIESGKQEFLEIFLGTTNVVSKVNKGSGLGGISFGVAKLSQKVTKDIAILESHIFPNAATGSFLDAIAKLWGISPRFGPTGSSTYVRLVADPGTVYTPGVHNLTGNHGVTFQFVQPASVPAAGYTYVKIDSLSAGEATKVNPLSVNQMTSSPGGHKYVINEFFATGGRDTESDDDFRKRIKEGVNIMARGTLAMYLQAFQKINDRVLRVYNGGSLSGKYVIYLVPVDGVDFSQIEFDAIIQRSDEYLSLTEFSSGITLKNVNWFPVDITMRLEVKASFDVDQLRIRMQTSLQKLLDWRYWGADKFLEWEDLLLGAKQTRGVQRILDNFFFPNFDILPPPFYLPRIRNFLLLDLDGTILSGSAGNVFDPSFYPNLVDYSFQQTVLNSI